MEENQDNFNLLRKIQNRPESTQRELAKDLGFSLGKLNYCLKELNKKGLIKFKNFKNKKKKNHVYQKIRINAQRNKFKNKFDNTVYEKKNKRI